MKPSYLGHWGDTHLEIWYSTWRETVRLRRAIRKLRAIGWNGTEAYADAHIERAFDCYWDGTDWDWPGWDAIV